MIKITVDKEFLRISEMICFFRFEKTGEHKEILSLENNQILHEIKIIHRFKYFKCLMSFIFFSLKEIPSGSKINFDEFCDEIFKKRNLSVRKYLRDQGFSDTTITYAIDICWLFCLKLDEKSRTIEIFYNNI